MRHSAASLAIASGADVKVVEQMLGHKSATMTLDQYGICDGRCEVVGAVGCVPMCTTGEVVELTRDTK